MIDNSCDYYQNIQDRNALSLFCLNCQGLKAHWESFCNLVSDIHGELYEHYFDIIGNTELYSMSRGEYSLDGYHALEFKTCDETTGSRGGVGMYIKKNINYIIREDLSVLFQIYLNQYFVRSQYTTQLKLLEIYIDQTSLLRLVWIFLLKLYIIY